MEHPTKRSSLPGWLAWYVWFAWATWFAWAASIGAALLLSGCAFPLFNVEYRSAPKRFAYTSPARRRAAAEEAPPARTGAERLATPELGPRKSSVLDPTPLEPNEPAAVGSCFERLDRAGVRYERVDAATPGVKLAVRLRGPVAGVTFATMDKSPVNAVLDCRLALALVDWARELRRAGVRKVDYYSMYRPGARIGGDGNVSSHAHGLAIDAARFELDSGVVLDVLSDWENRERGKAPCPLRRDEASGSRLLRGVACRAADRNLFQVILTPHYNKAHANHLHLEIKPASSDEVYLR
jgi:hypothetical protein